MTAVRGIETQLHAGVSRLAASRRNIVLAATTSVRVLAGTMLALYYATRARFTPALWSAGGGWYGTAASTRTLLAPLAAALLQLGPHGLLLWFASGIAISLLFAAGVSPRACALALWAIGAATYQASLPAATLDDYMAQVAPLWLALTITGERAAIVEDRDDGWAALVCLAFVLIFYLDACLGSAALPPLARLGIFGIAACAVAPLGRGRLLALFPAALVATHVVRLPGTAIGGALSLVLAAIGVVGTFGAHPQTRHVFGLRATLGACVVALIALRTVAANAGAHAVARSTERMLAAVGMAPYGGFNQPEDASHLDLAFHLDDRDSPAQGAYENPRLRSMLWLLGDHSPAFARERIALTRSLVGAHCLDAKASMAAESGTAILRRRGAARSVAWFQCGEHGEPPAVVPFDGEFVRSTSQ